MESKQKEALKFAAYGYLFPEIEKPRNQRRSLQILEGAISVYARHGAENATDQLVAAAAGVSRPLIFRYFKDREELFKTATKYVRVNFQHFAIGQIQKEKNIDGMLRAYVHSTFSWVEEYPEHAKVLLFFLYTCSQQKAENKVNTEFVDAGHRRITALVQIAVEQGVSRCENAAAAAKMIQTLITGGMVSWVSESLPMGKDAYRDWMTEACLALAGMGR
jgi:AcrR family transcriptional regulator